MSVNKGTFAVLVCLIAGILLMMSTQAMAFIPSDTDVPFDNTVTANKLLGQGNTGTNTSGSDAPALSSPAGVTVDTDGNVYVVDRKNHRIVIHNNLATDTVPDAVIGGALTGGSSPGTDRESFKQPRQAAVWDAPQADTTALFVSDFENHRVLVFIDTSTVGVPFRIRNTSGDKLGDIGADHVIGQPDFTSGFVNYSSDLDGTDDTGFIGPVGLDVQDTAPSSDRIHLFVADKANHRVLRFTILKDLLGNGIKDFNGSDTAANRVWGASGFGEEVPGTTKSKLESPVDVWVESTGGADSLYIADIESNRVVADTDANDAETEFDVVWGAPDLNTEGSGGDDPTDLNDPRSVARFDSDLAISDASNNRILFYSDPYGIDTRPVGALGDTNLHSTETQATRGTSNRSIQSGYSIEMSDTSLWVAEFDGNRVSHWTASTPFLGDQDKFTVSKSVFPPDTDAVLNASDVEDSSTNQFTSITMDQSAFESKSNSKNPMDAVNLESSDPDYRFELPLLEKSNDKVILQLWTNQSNFGLFYGLRSDTKSLNTDDLPAGISSADTDLKAFGRSAFLLEFADSSGKIIGTDTTTDDIGGKFAYRLIYDFSQATAEKYEQAGFNIRPGSSDFKFYFADSYDDRWSGDPAEVNVESATGGGIRVKVGPLSKDLPGGLGKTGSGENDAGYCLIERSGLPQAMLDVLRAGRDESMRNAIGRVFTDLYYTVVSVWSLR